VLRSLLSSSSSVLPSSLVMVQSSLLPMSCLVVVPAFFLLVLLVWCTRGWGKNS
jgi:uncharacterized membrane protein YdbT with pleckstrin-like domain